MSGALYRLGHFCVRRRRPVVALWCVFIVGVVAAVVILGAQTSNNLTLPGTGSTKATDLLAKYLPRDQFGTVPIVLVSDSGKLTDSANRKAVNATVKSLAAADGVYKAVSPLSDKGSDALSKDGKTGYISLTLTISPDDLSEDEANTIIDAAQPARDAGLEVSAGGYLGQEVSKPSTHVSEVIGLGFAVIILLFAFGTATAMSLPIVIALVSVIGGLSLIGLLGNVAPVATVAPTLGLMIGLGVGIDYSLFIVTRYREKRQQGVETDEAIARTVATTGSAIVFAGSTVVIALVSLLFAQIPIVTTLGYSAALVVVVAVCAAVTLLPALLAMLGARIDSLKVPFGGKGHTDHRPHGWARWAEGVARHPGRR